MFLISFQDFASSWLTVMAFSRLVERKMLKSCALTRQRESIIKIACWEHIWESQAYTHTQTHTHTNTLAHTVDVAVDTLKSLKRKSVNENPFGRIFQLIYFWLISFVCYFTASTWWYNPNQNLIIPIPPTKPYHTRPYHTISKTHTNIYCTL